MRESVAVNSRVDQNPVEVFMSYDSASKIQPSKLDYLAHESADGQDHHRPHTWSDFQNYRSNSLQGSRSNNPKMTSSWTGSAGGCKASFTIRFDTFIFGGYNRYKCRSHGFCPN